jgi:hypothetical protein
MSPQNLTNVYNQNPTLQGQYTLQQYLDLFGQGSTTTPTKNPAMWGLGYEGLASLQDLIMSIPFNQGGIVNIRRR